VPTDSQLISRTVKLLVLNAVRLHGPEDAEDATEHIRPLRETSALHYKGTR